MFEQESSKEGEANPKRSEVGARHRPAPINLRTQEMLGELIEGMCDLKIHATKMRGENTSKEVMPPRRCIWCDSLDHFRRDCASFQDALQNDRIYLKDGRIHLTETQAALIPNFGRGGMKKAMDESDVRGDSTVYHVALVGIQVADDKKDACFSRKVLKFAGKSVVNK